MHIETINSFLQSQNIAVVGVSSKGKGFGAIVYKHLKQNGYKVFPVNINGGTFENQQLYKSITDINSPLDSIITVVPPKVTEMIVKEANQLNIKKIWMQQGSESQTAIKYCNENGIDVVHDECILMFSEPVKSMHSFHRWIWKIIGKYPS